MEHLHQPTSASHEAIAVGLGGDLQHPHPHPHDLGALVAAECLDHIEGEKRHDSSSGKRPDSQGPTGEWPVPARSDHSPFCEKTRDNTWAVKFTSGITRW